MRRQMSASQIRHRIICTLPVLCAAVLQLEISLEEKLRSSSWPLIGPECSPKTHISLTDCIRVTSDHRSSGAPVSQYLCQLPELPLRRRYRGLSKERGGGVWKSIADLCLPDWASVWRTRGLEDAPRTPSECAPAS